MVQSFRRVLAVIYKNYRGKLFLSQFLLLIAAASLIGIATLIQQIINQGIEAHNLKVIIDTGIWMLALAIVGGGAITWTASLAVFFAQGTAYVIRVELYNKLQSFSFANFDRFRTGNLMVRLNADVNNLMYAVMYSVLLLLFAPFMIVVALILTVLTTPNMLWVLLAVAAIVLVLMAIIVPRIFAAYSERQKRLDDLNNTLQENLAGARIVKAFVREELENERFEQRADAMRKPAFRAAFWVAALAPLLSGIAQLSTVFVIWAGGADVLSRAGMSVGDLVRFMQYLSLVVTPLALMAIVVPFILRGDTSARRIFEVYDALPLIVDAPDAKPLDPQNVGGRLVFENVSFAFARPDGTLDPPVLKHINLTIEPGQRIGFLGATGAGKTALVNLIPRFYDVTEGRITIDGIDIRSIAQDDLRRIVGIALQEAVLFQGDVRFNLKFANPQADDDVMIRAAQAADAYGFVTNLPGQWEAEVARRGYNFSGGQRQRLSMGRALAGEPRILILDDSTSALDVATESRVQGAIPATYAGITTLYVAQRISAVIDLDKIVLLQYGEIVDMGSHEELIERSQLYRDIYESQLGSGVTAGVDLQEVAG